MTTSLRTVHELAEAVCWQLLATAEVGRLVVTGIGGEPDVFPVNYAVHEGRLLFRTDFGTKLVDLLSQHAVVFEIDGRDAHEAWSVVVKGTALPVRDAAGIRRAELAGVRPWAPDGKPVHIAITPHRITGRRFVRH